MQLDGHVELTQGAEGIIERDLAAIEAHSMIAGAIGFFFYALACVYWIGMRHVKAKAAALALLGVWAAVALGLWVLWIR